MRPYTLLATGLILLSFIAMGCNDDDSNESPRAELIMEPEEGWIYDNETGVTNPEITFNATGSEDPDGEIANYHYDFGEGNSTDLSEATYEHTYETAGYFHPAVTVQDSDGDDATASRPLTINYQYIRETQVLESTAGTSTEREHPFPVSSHHPDSGVVTLDIEAPDYGSPPSVNVTVYNDDGEEVKRERRENIQGNITVTIDIDQGDFDQYGHGQWKVFVEVENGNITYDIAVQVMYRE